jgi:DNA-binding transcriptional LysR family regulator
MPFAVAHREARSDAQPRRHLAQSQLQRCVKYVIAGPCGEIPLAACAAAGFVPEIVHHLSDYSAALALVDAGAGITTLAIVAPPPAVTIRRLSDPPTRNIYAAVRAGAEASPGLQAVLAALTDSCPTHSERRAAPLLLKSG